MLNILLISFIWYQIIAIFGISGGLHRYFAHKQYEVPVWYEWVILFLSTVAGARSPIGWIGVHRMHHHHSDTELDPHSPKYKGFFNVLFNRWNLKAIPSVYVKDLFDNPRLVFFHKYWKYVWLIFALTCALIDWKVFLALVVIPGILSYIGFGWVNAICHSHEGGSRNVFWVNILTGGEGYHDEHHKDGKKIRMGKWDVTGFIFEKLYLHQKA